MNKQQDFTRWSSKEKVFNPVADYESRMGRHMNPDERVSIRIIGKESAKEANKAIEKAMEGK